jgi:two-component system NtrC family sensor kinase
MDTQDNSGRSGSLDQTQEGDFPYFRRLWKSIVVALLAASFIPMLVIGGGMYYYTVSIIEEKTLHDLRMEISEHREAIDAFLSERTMDLKLLSSNLGLGHLTTPGALEKLFRSLQAELPCFTDLSIIDDEGRHLAYVGPHDLLTRNYRETFWFKAVREYGVYISDVFMGFRSEPHFVIAVKQTTNEGFWIMRATVDMAYFDRMVAEVLSERKGDAFIVSRTGVFQTTPRTGGKLMGRSEIKTLEPFSGVRLERKEDHILVMAWLERVPWLCVAQYDRKEIYRPLRYVWTIGGFVFVLGGILILGTVLLTTNFLIMRLETKRRRLRFLDDQLRHSSKVASSMHLASGMVQEMNDTLSNIDMVVSWLQDLSSRDLTKERNRDEIRESLNQIKAEVSRGRRTTDKFHKATRRSLPMIKEVRVNDLLEEILDLLERELKFNMITVRRDYEDPLPLIRSDPTQLRQVFQNLILNAVTAIQREGEITLAIRGRGEGVMVSVADTGPGIPRETIGKIFDPQFTAKPDGTGLGLSISAGILQKLGGRISAESEQGKGATFTVEIPSAFKLPEP